MSERPDEAVQRASFNALVEAGVYSDAFEHPAFLQRFFTEIVLRDGGLNGGRSPLSVLDCGCGTGAWLQLAIQTAKGVGVALNSHGFDLSDGMVSVAAAKLAEAAIQRGDLLDPASYVFGEIDSFDLVYAFDAVQQLPRRRQLECCRIMLDHVRPGGALVVFDHDAASPYGRSMARKKFLTRYLGLRLVPRYYCNASYPPLARFAETLSAEPGVDCRLIAATDSPKMALVAQRAGKDTG